MRESAAPRRVLVATGNAGKVAEIRAILGDVHANVRSLEGRPAIEFPEEGEDYAANAAAKAQAVADQLDEIAVADDSGLEVDALGGAPGPLSARYGGLHLDDSGRVETLLSALAGTAADRRGARFVCVAALAVPGHEVMTVRAECEGSILTAPHGTGGFGYDPIFQPAAAVAGRSAGSVVSMAELSAAEKNELSHRGRAFRALRAALDPHLRG